MEGYAFVLIFSRGGEGVTSQQFHAPTIQEAERLITAALTSQGQAPATVVEVVRLY